MAMAAPIFSLASAGMGALGSITSAQGQQKADEFEAQQAINAAQYGRTKAAQTGEIMTRNMTRMLGHIAAVRASAGADIRSPTTAAIMSSRERMAENQRGIEVGNVMAQVNQEDQAAGMYTQMGQRAMMGGYLGAAGGLLGGLGGMFKSAGVT